VDMKYFISVALLVIILNSCWPKTSVLPAPQKVWGYKPVYTADTTYREIEYIKSAQPVVNAGKIYVKDDLIYQCETGKGIHIIDNADPAHAKRIAFLAIKGCEEIAIKGNLLYTNNYYDLVTVDISIPEKAHIVARNKDVFYAASTMPHTWEMPEQSGYFQCAQFYQDSVISGWVQDSIYVSCYK
jgi:hypothetical protein